MAYFRCSLGVAAEIGAPSQAIALDRPRSWPRPSPVPLVQRMRAPFAVAPPLEVAFDKIFLIWAPPRMPEYPAQTSGRNAAESGCHSKLSTSTRSPGTARK